MGVDLSGTYENNFLTRSHSPTINNRPLLQHIATNARTCLVARNSENKSRAIALATLVRTPVGILEGEDAVDEDAGERIPLPLQDPHNHPERMSLPLQAKH